MDADFQQDRVGTVGLVGVLVERKIPGSGRAYGKDNIYAEQVTLRFENGKVCTYKASYVSWHKIYNRTHNGWERKEEEPTAWEELRKMTMKMKRAEVMSEHEKHVGPKSLR